MEGQERERGEAEELRRIRKEMALRRVEGVAKGSRNRKEEEARIFILASFFRGREGKREAGRGKEKGKKERKGEKRREEEEQKKQKQRRRRRDG